MKKLLTLVIILHLFRIDSFAQMGTEFWFAAPHISEHSRVTGEYHIVLFAYNQSAHVVISMPANSSFVNMEYDLQPYESVDVIMASGYDDAAANFEVPFDVVSQRGIHITSTAKIGGYYQHAGNNSEAFSFKKNALGTDFLVTSQISYLTQNNDSYVEAYSSIQIVATEDNTTVRITPLTGHQLGTTCSSNQVVVNLNRGETYAIRSCSKDPAYGINGTHITSNKAIAVTSTDDSTHPVEDFNIGLDLTGEQLVPTSLAGTEYIVVGEQKEWNVCYVTALENGTTVNLGNGTSFSIQQYQTRTISMSAIKALYISSDKPIIVYQITGEDDEAAGTVLPTLACTGSSYAAYTKLPNSFKAIFNIVVKAADINKISINGAHLASSNFHTIPGTTLWYYASVDLESYSSDVIKIQSDGGLFQLGALDMIGTSMTNLKSCSYGYFSDYGTAHEYDEYDIFEEGTTYIWLNHFISGTTTPITFTSEGIYRDTLIDTNGCDSIVTLHLSESKSSDSIEYAVICEGETYTWHGKTYTTTTDVTEIIPNVAGRDSICTLHLIVNPSYAKQDTMVVSDTILPIQWNGQTISKEGVYYYSDTTIHGCDSTITLTVIVRLYCDTLVASVIIPDVCAEDDSIYVDVSYSAGTPVAYVLTFGKDAVDQGFLSSYNGDVQLTSGATAVISIPLPKDAADKQKYPRPNTYKMDISISDACGVAAQWTEQTFTIRYPSWLLLQRWNDVLSIRNEDYNGGYVFSDIKWFHEGMPIEGHGEHSAYIYETPNLVYGDAYWAELTRADDGVTITTCPYYPVKMQDDTQYGDVIEPYVTVTPTVVSPQNMSVNVTTNICGTYFVYNSDGNQLGRHAFCPPLDGMFTIDLAPYHVGEGMYMIAFHGVEGSMFTTKVIVKQ